MSEIRFEGATLNYPDMDEPTIAKLDLCIRDGEFLALVGPSGSGKSSTLRMVAGLEPLSSGEIYIAGQAASKLAPSKRDVAMVFQSYALYPHMSVYNNLAFALKMQGVNSEEQKTRVQEAARMLGLEPYLNRLPKELSGGQRQRVAMGRAIVRKPRVFLMDEPLSNLDAKLRVSTRTEIMKMQRTLKTTMLYVTHDQTEAMTMADRIAVLESGKLQQVGTPEELYNSPANLFVATFIGSPSMNILQGYVQDNAFQLGTNRFELPKAPQFYNGRKLHLGIRPEAVRMANEGETEHFQAVSTLVENVGPDYFVHVEFGGNSQKNELLIRLPQTTKVAVGDLLKLVVSQEEIHFFDAESGERLSK